MNRNIPTRQEILRMRRAKEISNAEALRLMREAHAEQMRQNQERLAEYQRNKQAAKQRGEIGLGFPKQHIHESVLDRYRARKPSNLTGAMSLAERQAKVIERAQARAEKRRQRLLARHGRYGNRYS